MTGQELRSYNDAAYTEEDKAFIGEMTEVSNVLLRIVDPLRSDIATLQRFVSEDR